MNLEKFQQTLSDLRQLQRDILIRGLDAAYLYVDDVEGDWLDKWDEEEEIKETLISFLSSGDHVAIRVRKRLGEQPIGAIAGDLERCLSLPVADKLSAVTEMLASNGDRSESPITETRVSGDDVELQDLAEALLERLRELLRDN